MNPNRQSISSLLLRCAKCLRKEAGGSYHRSRLYATTSTPVSIDPNTVFTPKEEKELASQGKSPIGSRRRRAALATSPGIPFDQLPYQCFQEALKIISEQRAETVKKLEYEVEKIERMQKLVDEEGLHTTQRQAKIRDMTKHVNDLLIQADEHDPRIKMTFEDGLGM